VKCAILDVTQYSWVGIHQRFGVKFGSQNVTSNFFTSAAGSEILFGIEDNYVGICT
jgi:hypothetical protein